MVWLTHPLMDEFFHPLRLGTVKQQPAGREQDILGPDSRQYRDDHDAWRESISLEPREDYEEHAEATVFDQLRRGSLPSRGVVLILGEPGAGKTSLLEEWHRRWWSAPGPIRLGLQVPVLIRLKYVIADWQRGASDAIADRLWNELGQSTTQAVVKGAETSRLPTLSQRLWTPIWLLDGLDEGPVPIGDERLWDALAALPGKVLVTCRTAVFEPARPEARRYLSREYRVLPLEPGEQPNFLANAMKAKLRDPAKAEGLVRQLNADAALRPLATVPLMLRLVAEIGESLVLPSDRAQFYERAIRELWYRRLQAHGELIALSRDRDRALAHVVKEVGLEKLQVSSEVLNTAGIFGSLKEALKISGLLQFDDRRGNANFPHLTFQEYHLARSWEGRTFAEVLDEYWARPRYEEALALMLAMRWRSERIEATLITFVHNLRTRHANDPAKLWSIGRSPFVLAMSLLARAGVAAANPLLGAEMAPVAVRINLAVRRTTSPDALARLAGDPDIVVRQSVAKNNATPPETLALLAEGRSPYSDVRRSVANNNATPPDILTRLAEDPDPGIRRGVAGNRVTPPETVWRLASDADERVRWVANLYEGRPRTTRAEESKKLQALVALKDNTPPETFARLAEDPDITVRHSVAWNNATPSDTLARLAEDKDEFVRAFVAGNNAAPPDILARLAADPEFDDRRSVANNNAPPPEALARLAEDTDDRMRLHVAGNEATPPETLARLAEDPNYAVRLAVQFNKGLLPEDVWPLDRPETRTGLLSLAMQLYRWARNNNTRRPTGS